MIIKGGRRGGARQLAAHLLRQDTNDQVLLREMDSYPSANRSDDDLKAALKLMAAQGQAKGKLRILYHAIIAPQLGEILNAKQLKHAADLLAKNLGMEGHQRVIVEHHKSGRQHFHVVFNILHPATSKQARLQWTKKIEWNTSRQLEQELGLKPVAPKGKQARRWECERGKRSGLDPLKIRQGITAIYHASKTGAAFVANLDKAGFVLTTGRNGSYVLVDKTGDIHGLMRRIEGAKLKNLRQKFPDLKSIPLPALTTVLKSRRPEKGARSKLCGSFRQMARKNTQRGHYGAAHGKTKGKLGVDSGRVGSFAPSLAPRHTGATRIGSSFVMNRKSTTTSQPQPAPLINLNKRTRRRNRILAGDKPIMPTLRKSLLLVSDHAMQWKELSTRYAIHRQAAQHEPDENTREAMLAALEAQEEAERSVLAAKQQAETDNDLAAQNQEAVRKLAPRRSSTPKLT